MSDAFLPIITAALDSAGASESDAFTRIFPLIPATGDLADLEVRTSLARLLHVCAGDAGGWAGAVDSGSEALTELMDLVASELSLA